MGNIFGENLKTIRKKLKISQKDLAKELDFTNNQINDWERGNKLCAFLEKRIA